MIPNQEYIDRRAALQKLIKQPIVITAHQQMQAKADMAHPFVQDASFLYLSGINEADWMLFWDLKKWYLVRPTVSGTHELFDGTLSSAEAIKSSGISDVLTAEEFETKITELAQESDLVFTLGRDPHEKYYDFSINPASKALNRKLAKLFKEVSDLRPELRKLRATKSKVELKSQRHAIDGTVDAFKDIKNKLVSLTHEYQIEAHLSYLFRVKGTEGHSYAPIVAAGAHACTLHYGKNQAELPKNGLVLIDAGTQFDGYAADITRTYAVGKPTQRQVDVHGAVQRAHYAIIDLIKPGISFELYQKQVDEIMKHELLGLGLIKDMKDEESYRKYFPHAIGHGLGLDVHESLGGYKEFQPGMVLTVEPGIYIPEEGIGVRIEDNILVTISSNENLSKDLSTDL